MKLRYFTATAFSAVVAVSFLPKAVAGSNYKLVEQNGKVYCIGTTAGTYYYAGQNVAGFGVNGETDRAEYSSTVPVNPENGNTGNVNQGLDTNRNHWSNEGQSVWGFDYYTNGSSNTVAKKISKDGKVNSLQFATGIGSANRLRGFINGKHQPNVPDKEVRAYTVENVAYSVSLNLCGYGIEDYSDDIPPVNLSKTSYTTKELLSGQVKPIFEGGTLLFDKNALYSADDFLVTREGGKIDNGSLNVVLSGNLSGPGGLSFKGAGLTTLSGINAYTGDTNIESGILKVTGSLSDKTAVSVNQSAVYKVASTDTVGSIEGAGDIQIFPGTVLTTGGNDKDTTFSGVLRGDGGLSKIGSGVLTISGSKNNYQGSTAISGGTLKLGSATGIPQASATVVNYGGTLDLNNQSPVINSLTLNGGDGSGTLDDILENTAQIKGGNLPGTVTSNGGLLIGVTGANAVLNAESGRTFLRDGVNLGTGSLTGGQLWAADDDTAVFKNFTLNTAAVVPDEPGKGAGLGTNNPGLVVGFGDKNSYSMRIGVDAQGNDNGGSFAYTGGNLYLFNPVTDADRNSDRSQYEGTWNVLDFTEGDLTAAEYSTMFDNTYLLLVAPDGSDYDYLKFNAAGVPVDPKGATREVELVKGSLKVKVGGVNPNLDEGDVGLGGDGISADDGLAQDIAKQFQIMSAEDLAEGVRRAFLPRNIDAAGQAMANYNNLLADTIFERTPMRRFTEVEVAAVEPVTELEVEPVVEPAAEPVRGLWSKSGELNDAVAGEYLEQKVDPQPLVIADAQIAADHQEQHLIEVNGRTYAEDDSLTAEYADVEGVRGWFRGFGGSSGDYNGKTGTVYNPYGISGGGGVVGADVSLSESFQLGAYANYGDISLWQTNSGETFGGGGWNADGWGGGITADYWTNNFYVQGLLGATGFSGEQRRTIKEYGAMYTAGTAKGEKSSSSMVGALRIGAPFQSGSTYFEPQFTATWSGNNENRFSESADDDRLGLTYKGRNTNYLQTALGMKFAWPMKTGETGLLTPSVKLAWLGDWNMGNEDQKIGFDFSDKTYSVGSNQENQNGGLIEAGLDYSVAKIESTTVKAYLRGGAEVWGGNRGTNWRASGGMTFQF